MSVRLTETERRVAELYSRGMRPREIAESLGISINTVYKALSRARKAMELTEAQVEAEPRYAPQYYTFNTLVYVYPSAQPQLQISLSASRAVVVHDSYDAVLRKLDEIISLLKGARVERRAAAEPAPPNRSEADGHGGNGHLPDALKRNVWISLLRSRAT
ncbi:helix-turn-helix domain-containing protein [Pyrobaculum sp. 3827-6]|uniref:sigma factor-like helix-turn-helix DNA-binding protein n=1 Tax=Pyrobaculum sp. 3827-6 TaxID=2983604 RepID=UPI0021D9DC42|nr:sigma factor-like helix-turn-helix DNA-binding protein [Pyrobaculum sp. 3827-6]MCU7787264.1 helix-turn-helix domain-containing protein [Pyrobaculum sp. 3827-6]